MDEKELIRILARAIRAQQKLRRHRCGRSWCPHNDYCDEAVQLYLEAEDADDAAEKALDDAGL